MSGQRFTMRWGKVGRRIALASVLALIAAYGLIALATPAAAAPLTGGFSPTVINGAADLNGDNEATGRDDANAFYGDTSIIDGWLDCNNWAGTNDGTQGDGVIDTSDDCTLIGYDGSVDGVEIFVVDGAFDVSDGPLPQVFNAADPDNPGVLESDFAWSAIGGRVDSDGNEAINANDCTFGLVGVADDAGLGDATDGYDVLGNTQGDTNPCGFGSPHPTAAMNGLVDLNSDGTITAADSCDDGCFFGHNVDLGFVQAEGTVEPAGVFSGGFSPMIVGGKADLNGVGTVDGADDANAFYGDTSIIDGMLDCDAWTSDNDGTGGSGAIDANDDCTLIGYDGTADGVTIDVVDGEFQVADGPLPFVFNAAEPDNPDVGDSDFAWSTIAGRVDSNGNELIDAGDCHFGLIGKTADAGLGDASDGADILSNDLAESNPCGFAVGPDPASNGLVDLDDSGTITVADSCNNCFFGHDVDTGFVMALVAETLVLTPETATVAVGSPHTVTAHVEDGTGTPVENVMVLFAVTGANPTSGSDATDANGDAVFTYTGAAAGPDTITAFADNDGDSSQDAGDPGDTATATWTLEECPGYEGDPRNDVIGTDLGEALLGTAGEDIICAKAGNDTLKGFEGEDLLLGGGGKDTAMGGAGADEIRGAGGADTLKGGGGPDSLFGGKGDDTLNGGKGNDTCVGGPGKDKLKSC